MTKLSDLGPPIVGKQQGPLPPDEHDHFYNCPLCGQMVDQRDARQVFYHKGPGHESLEPEPDAKVLNFARRPLK